MFVLEFFVGTPTKESFPTFQNNTVGGCHCLASSPGHSQILSRSRREKSGEGLVQYTSRAGNGGLDFIMMATCPRNVRPVQQAIEQSSLSRRFANSYGLCKYQVANEGCVDVSGGRYACTSTEKSSRLRASASLRVKVSVCTRTTVLKEPQNQG